MASEFKSVNSLDHIEPLVNDFRKFLQQEGLPWSSQPDQPDHHVDLHALFTELAALKTEVKRESRQVKEATSQFGSLFDTLRDNNQQLSRELDQRQAQQAGSLFASRQPMLVEIIELRERLELTLHALKNHRPYWFEKWLNRGDLFRQDMGKGLEITLRRVDKILSDHDIEPLSCLGQPLDPHTMRAVKVKYHQESTADVVIAVIRRGYSHHGEVVRLAEVVVNRHRENTPSR